MHKKELAARCLDRLFTMMYRSGIMKYDDYVRDVCKETGAAHGEVKFVNRYLKK